MNDSITFAEFKSWLHGLIIGKQGALPDLEDWKQIKTMMDKVEEPSDKPIKIDYTPQWAQGDYGNFNITWSDHTDYSTVSVTDGINVDWSNDSIMYTGDVVINTEDTYSVPSYDKVTTNYRAADDVTEALQLDMFNSNKASKLEDEMKQLFERILGKQNG